MQNIQFPLQMEFKLSIRTEIRVTDASGRLLAVVKEKMFSLRDEVRIYSDDAKTQQAYTIKAKGVLAGLTDWKTSRTIVRTSGEPIGALGSQGLRTMWAASYQLVDGSGNLWATIQDDKPWMGAVEGVIDAVPVVGEVAGVAFDYLVNPTYTVRDSAGGEVARIHKKRSWMSRRFEVEALRPLPDREAELLVLGLIQLVLLERDRG